MPGQLLPASPASHVPASQSRKAIKRRDTHADSETCRVPIATLHSRLARLPRSAGCWTLRQLLSARSSFRFLSHPKLSPHSSACSYEFPGQLAVACWHGPDQSLDSILAYHTRLHPHLWFLDGDGLTACQLFPTSPTCFLSSSLNDLPPTNLSLSPRPISSAPGRTSKLGKHTSKNPITPACLAHTTPQPHCAWCGCRDWAAPALARRQAHEARTVEQHCRLRIDDSAKLPDDNITLCLSPLGSRRHICAVTLRHITLGRPIYPRTDTQSRR